VGIKANKIPNAAFFFSQKSKSIQYSLLVYCMLAVDNFFVIHSLVKCLLSTQTHYLL